ncbi:MAG TPA: TetR/AcrR family transcriptional regulator [Mycobacteriales bacterium]|nr:TetR/AcrR family transcriptional regulator [Mycobacteriales bacterium]
MTTAARALVTPAPVDLLAGKSLGPRHLEILDGLETVVLTEGFRDLTVGTIAQRLHCSRRTLYEIADSKEELVLLVIDRVLRRLARVAHEAARHEDALLERLRAFLTTGLTELHRATLAFSEDVAAFPEAARLLDAHFRYAHGTVESLLVEGIDAGEFAPIHPRIATETSAAGLQRLLDPDLLREAGVSFAEAISEYMTLFTDGIRAQARGTS